MDYFRKRRHQRDGDACQRDSGPRALQRIVNRIAGKKITSDASFTTSITDARFGKGDVREYQGPSGTLQGKPDFEGPESHLESQGTGRKETPVIFYARGSPATRTDTKTLDGVASQSPESSAFASTAPELDSSVAISTLATPLDGQFIGTCETDGHQLSSGAAGVEEPANRPSSEDSMISPSLWDRAYIALQETYPDLLKEYEALIASSRSRTHTFPLFVKPELPLLTPLFRH